MPIFYTYNLGNNPITNGVFRKIGNSVSITCDMSRAHLLKNYGNEIFRLELNWSKYRWKGPPIPEFIPSPELDYPIDLSMYLSIYKSQNNYKPFSKQANKNFEDNCFKKFGVKINVNRLPFNLGFWMTPTNADKASVDGVWTDVENWQPQKPTISSTGFLIPGVSKSDIVMNKTDKGSFWLAKWSYKNVLYFSTLTKTHFTNVTDMIRIPLVNPNDDEDDSNSSDEDSNFEVRDDSDESDDSGDYNDDEDHQAQLDDPIVEMEIPGRNVKRIKAEESEVISVEEEFYTQKEKTFLPIGYMLPRSVEWMCVMEAIETGFKNVKRLFSVRDHTLREFYYVFKIFTVNSKYDASIKHLKRYIRKRLAL